MRKENKELQKLIAQALRDIMREELEAYNKQQALAYEKMKQEDRERENFFNEFYKQRRLKENESNNSNEQ